MRFELDLQKSMEVGWIDEEWEKMGETALVDTWEVGRCGEWLKYCMEIACLERQRIKLGVKKRDF